MAKISKSAVEKRLVQNFQNEQPTNEQVVDAMLKRFKKETKKELLMENYNMHRYYMTKKERRLEKAKLSRIK